MLNGSSQPLPTRSHVGDHVLPPASPHSPLLMFVLSFFCIAGLGQIVMGQTIKGMMILIGSMLFAVATAGLSILVIWPLSGVDAYCIAKKLQAGKSVGQWEFF